jgi:outer membrane receptor protein involved in Fe transport
MIPLNRSFVTAALLLMLAAAGHAQEQRQPAADSTAADTVPEPVYVLKPLNVTATRSEKNIFLTAAPVSVVEQQLILELVPNTGADLLRDLPGVDVNGVGTNQTRPIIRGQRGQRILLLEDDIRLNNSRRQQDFGEIPAIVDIKEVAQVEVVRGPASVLYGSDAIGGVINLRTNEAPPLSGGDRIGGSVKYSFRTAGNQHRPNVTLFGRTGGLGFRVSGQYRDTEPYKAPSGAFGNINLDDDVVVQDTGVRDRNFSALLDYAFSPSHRIFGRLGLYSADETGFGFVTGEDLGLDDPTSIELRYPDQKVDKQTLGYRGRDLGWAVADRLDVTTYRMNNEREFTTDVFIPGSLVFGPMAPPGSGIVSSSENFTDLQTLGFRVEAAKVISDAALLTYGVDLSHDDSENTDFLRQGVVGLGPPDFEESDVPNVPNATFQRFGVFTQGDLQLADPVSLIVGARFQDVRSQTEDTPGLEDLPPTEHDDQTVVAAANLLVEVIPELNIVAAVGRAFRAPNIIELYFNGVTAEGSGFLSRNPDLKAEKSLNFDVGLKFRRGRIGAEAYYFRNEITDGIRLLDTGEMVGPFPEFQNVNIDKLRFQGVELAVDVMPVDGLTLRGNFSHVDSKDVNNPVNPIGDTYSNKFVASAAYRDPGGRFWASYNLRHQGEQKDIDVGFQNAVGEVIPAFTVNDVRGGVRLFELGSTSHSLSLAVENLTNELYAEVSNATFFRPEPKRTLLVSWVTTF